jgi:hypothetical protein
MRLFQVGSKWKVPVRSWPLRTIPWRRPCSTLWPSWSVCRAEATPSRCTLSALPWSHSWRSLMSLILDTEHFQGCTTNSSFAEFKMYALLPEQPSTIPNLEIFGRQYSWFIISPRLKMWFLTHLIWLRFCLKLVDVREKFLLSWYWITVHEVFQRIVFRTAAFNLAIQDR